MNVNTGSIIEGRASESASSDEPVCITPSSKRYGKQELKPLTGIRAIAAWWVVIYHLESGYGLFLYLPELPRLSHPLIQFGYLGVDLFFMLSGFVIAYNYWDGFAHFNLRHYLRFLRMRLARIYPVHLATLLILLSLLLFARARHVGLNHEQYVASWTAGSFIENLLLIHHWKPHAGVNWNFPAWSISCEWLAYLFFPTIAMTRIDQLSTVLRVTSCAVLAGFIAIAYQMGFGDDLLRIAVEFPLGCLLFTVYRSGCMSSPRWYLHPAIPACLSLLLILLIGLSGSQLSNYWAVVPFPWLLYTLSHQGRDLISRILSSRAALFQGRASYSLYMTHAITCMVMNKVVPLARFQSSGVFIRLAMLAIWIFGCALGGLLCYYLIEIPGRHLLAVRRSANPVATASS